MLEGPLNRRGEVPTSDFHLRVRLSVPFTRADIHAGPIYVVLTIMLGASVALSLRPYVVGISRKLHLDFGEDPFHALR